VERLGHVVVGAGVQAVNPVGPAVARRQDQHGCGNPAVAPVLQDRGAVPHRQADVEDDHVIGFGGAKKPGFLTVIGDIDDATFGSK
jgi:hypothetical protein